MTEKSRYRHCLIDREGVPSPAAMRAFSRHWYEGDFRQTAASKFYMDLTRRYLRARRFRIGVHKLSVKRCLPSDFGHLFSVVAKLFIHNDEEQDRHVHPNTRKAAKHGFDSGLYAFYCDGTLYVFADGWGSLIGELCRQVQHLELFIRDSAK